MRSEYSDHVLDNVSDIFAWLASESLVPPPKQSSYYLEYARQVLPREILKKPLQDQDAILNWIADLIRSDIPDDEVAGVLVLDLGLQDCQLPQDLSGKQLMRDILDEVRRLRGERESHG